MWGSVSLDAVEEQLIAVVFFYRRVREADVTTFVFSSITAFSGVKVLLVVVRSSHV